MAKTGLNPTVYRLAGVHFVTDAYSNLFTPLLPALIPKLGLSLAGAGILVMLFQISGSVSQLGFGHIADRWRPRLLIVAGPLLSVTALSFVGAAPSAAMLAVFLVLGGLGGAAFHPIAATVVHRMGASHRGLAMAVHITGGSVGYSMAPFLFTPYVEHLGLAWTPLLAVPGLALIWIGLRGVPRVEAFGQAGGGGFLALRPFARPLFLLYLIVVLRTLTSLSFATFVPVLLTGRGWTMSAAGAAVAVYLFSASVGGFAGGPLADRFGPRRVIAGSLLLAVPFLAAATRLHDAPFVIMMALGGLFLQSTLPVNITFAHQIAPVSAGTVSSLMMGFAWGTGGLCVPLIGAAADRIGIENTLMMIAFLPLAAALCALPLPRERGRVQSTAIAPGMPGSEA